ncbi:Zinc finger, RING-type domain and Zinc finger, RING/FYVE/PHD-type domain-containing protein [Strongyloides ratti]|uniref:Zinc finger, RING-type domain and Zinc finger, RING/FYVE/PHD-type domain-containing protein n=1 Tax=Strongyloides ratti TaxID=34506 RepID=A0A090L009_STRRB|nr:Zinc finger, RING-type domain and Zinc finger, RING/FYVE/PHD-type domain-containing protein [Strongyloides ratti]CEF63110.1 Zinc finger, RING-type domain and Zinc finger, RING/FYVE/PHD-type domain-containing protein [Strongyloides ratti]
MAPRRNTLNSNHRLPLSCTSRNIRNNIPNINTQSSNNLQPNTRHLNQINVGTNDDNIANNLSSTGVQLRRSIRIANLQNLSSRVSSHSILQRENPQNINNNFENSHLHESGNSSTITSVSQRNTNLSRDSINPRNNRQNINRNTGRQNLGLSNPPGVANTLDSLNIRRNHRNVFHFSTSFGSDDHLRRQRRNRLRANINRSILNSAASYNIINIDNSSQIDYRVASRQPLINAGWQTVGSSFMTFGNLVPTRTMINALFSPANILRGDDEWPRTAEMMNNRYGPDVSMDDIIDGMNEGRRYPRRSSYNDTRRRIRSFATNISRRRSRNFNNSIRLFSSFPIQFPPERLEERLASIFPQGTSTLDIRNRQIMESPKPFPVPKDEIDKGISSEPEKCTICFEDICVDPVKCLHCRQQIGCFDCLKKWIRADAYVNSNQEEYVMHSKNMACPLCRHEWSYASRPEVFRLQNK